MGISRALPGRWVFLGIVVAAVTACATGTGEPSFETEAPTARPGSPIAVPTPLPTAADGSTPAPSPTPVSSPGDPIVPIPTPTVTHDAPSALPTLEPLPTYSPSVSGGSDQQDGSDPPPSGAQNPWSFVSDRQCGDGPLFSSFPMDLDVVPNLSPLGAVNPPGHTFPTSHMYFAVPVIWGEVGEGPFGDGQIFPPTPVYAVADGQLSSLSISTVTTSLSGEVVSYTEYGFDLAVCEGIRVRYGHVGPVSDRILESVEGLEGFNCNAYSTGDFAVDGCTYAPFLDLAAGEQVGFNSGRAAALDIGVFDTITQTIDFLHPELVGEEATGSLCLLDQYSPEQSAELAALLGNGELLRTANPICGVLNFDLPGTLRGNWFNDVSTFSNEDLNIAFVYDQVIPDQPIISIGFVPGIDSAAHMFTPEDEGRVNLRFAEVAAGDGVYCYENLRDRFDRVHPDKHLLVEIPEPGRLLVQAAVGASCGEGPWQLDADATEFLR
ncbi:MAG: hypothetical protein HOC77_07975 [Chloroflexi bacterium]|nr:hypothetical protein [Chloroflexota bacterium]MBT4072173.1 hypothetical protein [Chloroflexota bacterium]MBT4515008.1 hypothetical protein [Chloroflexota bacterium]MBT5319931.1 hypothetical protein [Chloroflexota bacterium]